MDRTLRQLSRVLLVWRKYAVWLAQSAAEMNIIICSALSIRIEEKTNHFIAAVHIFDEHTALIPNCANTNS